MFKKTLIAILYFSPLFWSGTGGEVMAQQLTAFDSVIINLEKAKTKSGVDTAYIVKAFASMNTLKITEKQHNLLQKEALKFKGIDNDDYYFAVKTFAWFTYLKPETYLVEIESGKQLLAELGDCKTEVQQCCFETFFSVLRIPFRNSEKIYEGFDFFSQKLTYYLQKNDSDAISDCYFILSGVYRTLGLKDQQIYNLQKSIEYINAGKVRSGRFPFVKNKIGRQTWANQTAVLGSAYLEIGDYKKTMALSMAALQSSMDNNAPPLEKLTGFIYSNIGQAYMHQNRMDSAKYFLDKAFTVASKTKIQDDYAEALFQYGIYYYKLNQIDSAVNYFNQCIQFMQEKNLEANSTSGNITPRYFLSLISVKQNKFIDAIKLIVEELPLLQNLRQEKLRDLKLLAEIYSRAGDEKKSNETYQQFVTMQEQLNADEKKNRSISYDVEAKIAASEKERKEAIIENQFATKSRNYLIGIAALILIIAVGLLNSYLSKNKDNKKLQNALSELEIETSLERVRSVALSMKEPNDLLSISEAMFTELQSLGFSSLRNGLIATFNKEEAYVRDYDYSDYAGGSSTRIPYNTNPIIDKFRNEIESAPDAFVEFSISQTELNEWKEYRRSNGEIDDPRLENISNLYYYFYSIGIAAIGISTFSSITEEQLNLLKRFRNVFELAYRRYADVAMAEAQSREAQIELALERVRARTMAMQNSHELLETAHVLFEQFKNLGEAPDQITIAIMNEQERLIEFWLTELGTGNKSRNKFSITIDEPHVMNKIYTSWKQQQKTLSIDLSGNELYEYVSFRSKASNAKINPEHLIGHRYIYVANFSKGAVTVSTQEPRTQQTVNLLERFAGVFDLTYTRFLDLKNAEAQAHEAQIETALERVRSRTLAMQHSDELAETAAVLFKQVINLGIEPNRLYITIIQDGVHQAEFWITDEDGSKVSSAFFADLDANPTFKKMYEGWHQKKKSITIDIHGEELQEYFEYLSNLHVPFKGGLSQTRRVQNIAYFGKGFIGLASPEPQPEETMQLLERFAYVFNLTFTRFNDLKIAEAHAAQAEEDLIKLQAEKKRAEDALTELKSTQQQLVQQEKLASLGALTAGIAHEIKNPLNFVNNFSELSNELVDEFIATNDEEERKEIANDLKLNLKKINEHGKRADSIVKNMLQHSRSGSGEKQMTDINQLCEEYFNIAFHGKRANDQAFNCEMIKNLDNNLPQVNCVTQDISRVILNLINNAFDAVKERSESRVAGDDYKPTVTLTTSKAVPLSPTGKAGEGSITISIQDNGKGIPSHIKEKIFEPFFTTKPAGQGTGLGLSLSNDIIKSHGGELKVESKENEFTEFIILLPIIWITD